MFVAIAIIFLLLTMLTKLPFIYLIVQAIGVFILPLVIWRSGKWCNGEESTL